VLDHDAILRVYVDDRGAAAVHRVSQFRQQCGLRLTIADRPPPNLAAGTRELAALRP